MALILSVLAHGGALLVLSHSSPRPYQRQEGKRIELVVTRSTPPAKVVDAPALPPPEGPKPPPRVTRKTTAEPPRPVAKAPEEKKVEPVPEPAPLAKGTEVAVASSPAGTLQVSGSPEKGSPDGVVGGREAGVVGGRGEHAPTRSQLMLDTSSALRFLDKVDPPKPAALKEAEFTAAPFLARVHDVIQSRWAPESSLRVRFADGRLRDSGVSRSVIAVTIDRSGAITQLNLAQRGKQDFLDEVALAAVRASSPFVNPPAGLFGSNDSYAFNVAVEITLNLPSVAEQMLGGPSLPAQLEEMVMTGKAIDPMCFRREARRKKNDTNGTLVIRGRYGPCAT